MADKQKQMSWRKCIATGVLFGIVVAFWVIPVLFWALVLGELKPRQIWRWVKTRDFLGPLNYALDRLEP